MRERELGIGLPPAPAKAAVPDKSEKADKAEKKADKKADKKAQKSASEDEA